MHHHKISRFLFTFLLFSRFASIERLVTGWAWLIPLQMAAAVLGISSPIHLPSESLPLVVRLDAILVRGLALMVGTRSTTIWITQMTAAWITSRQVKSRECTLHGICSATLALTMAMKAMRRNLRRVRSLPPRPAPRPAIHRSPRLLEPATPPELLAVAAKEQTIAVLRNVRRTRRPS